jgi:hypothetical protein
MPGEFSYIDATNDPAALSRTAKEVVKSRRSQLVKIGDDEIVQVSPVSTPANQPGSSLPDNSGLRSLIGIAQASDGATDVSENVDKYLADAIYAESHPPKEK